MYLISEIGVNHNGDINLAKEMVRSIGECNCDAIKFQFYNPDEVFKDDEVNRKWAWKCYFSADQLLELCNYAHTLGIQFGISIFDEDGINSFKDKNLDFIKLASRTVLHNWEFCKKVIDIFTEGRPTIGCPIIASINNETLLEILTARKTNSTDDNLLRSKLFDDPDVSTLYCSSNYPSDVKDYSYMTNGVFGEDECDGLSDHTLGIGLCLTAIARGATIIEKHFTLDKAMPGPDQVCSMTPYELRNLHRWGREIGRVVGQLQK